MSADGHSKTSTANFCGPPISGSGSGSEDVLAPGKGWDVPERVGSSGASQNTVDKTQAFVADLFELAGEAVPGAAADAADHPALAHAIEHAFIPTDCLRRTRHTEVWLGIEDRPDESIERPVIIKVVSRDGAAKLTSEDEEAPDAARRIQHMFAREAKFLADVNCQGVPKLFRFLRNGADSALVMEFVDGEDLTKAVEGLDDSKRLDLFLKLLDVVADLHRSQIVHRDLKPEHILVTPSGAPVVLDLGLACADESDGIGLAMSALLAGGTPRYMAPEVRPESLPRQDARLDVYALGVMLSELFTQGAMHRLLQPVIKAARTNDVERRIPDATQMRMAIQSRLRVRKRRQFGLAGGAGLASVLGISMFSVWAGQAGQSGQAANDANSSPGVSTLTDKDVVTPARLGPAYRVGQETADAIARSRQQGQPIDLDDLERLDLSIAAAEQAGHHWIAGHLQARAEGNGIVEDNGIPGHGLIHSGRIAPNRNVIWTGTNHTDGTKQVFWQNKGVLFAHRQSQFMLLDSDPETGQFFLGTAGGATKVSTEGFDGPFIERRFPFQTRRVHLRGQYAFFTSDEDEIHLWDLKRDVVAPLKVFAAYAIWLPPDPTRGESLADALVLLGNDVNINAENEPDASTQADDLVQMDVLSPRRYELWRTDDLAAAADGRAKPIAQWETPAGVSACSVFSVKGVPTIWMGLASGELVAATQDGFGDWTAVERIAAFRNPIRRIVAVPQENLAILDRYGLALELVDLTTQRSLMELDRHHRRHNIIVWDSLWHPDTRTITLLTTMGTRSWHTAPPSP